MTSVALPLTAVLVVHASAFSVAAISAAGSVPWLLLGFPAGVYVTRLPLRGVQVAMDLVRAVAIGSVPVVAWLGGLTVAQLIGVALAVGSRECHLRRRQLNADAGDRPQGGTDEAEQLDRCLQRHRFNSPARGLAVSWSA